MWLDNLKALKTVRGLNAKQIAEMENLSERTVTRIFSGETPNPSMDYLLKIVRALDGSLDDIFENTKAVVGGTNLAELQADVDRLREELALSNAENAVLVNRVSNLTDENEILRLKLAHAEEINAIHNYYIKLKATD